MGVLSVFGYQADPMVGVHLRLRGLGRAIPTFDLLQGSGASPSQGMPPKDNPGQPPQTRPDHEVSDIGVRGIEFRFDRVGPIGGFVIGISGLIDRVDSTTARLLGCDDPADLEGHGLAEFLVDPLDSLDIRRALAEDSENPRFIVELVGLDRRVFTAGISLHMRHRESGQKLIGSVMALA